MKLNLDLIKDAIYPVLCNGCGDVQEGGGYLCEVCFGSFKRVGEDGERFCSVCSEPFAGVFSENPVCSNCSGLGYSFDFARSGLVSSDEGRELMHDFKYGKQRHLAGVMVDFCYEAVQGDERILSVLGGGEDAVVVPVPLHWRREFRRGFNQAELISRGLADRLGLRHLRLLRRDRYTTTQTRLVRDERLKNLKGAFSMCRELVESDDFRQVILVDDVFTTGSTSEECASVVKKVCAKVENIVVVTVLRG